MCWYLYDSYAGVACLCKIWIFKMFKRSPKFFLIYLDPNKFWAPLKISSSGPIVMGIYNELKLIRYV